MAELREGDGTVGREPSVHPFCTLVESRRKLVKLTSRNSINYWDNTIVARIYGIAYEVGRKSFSGFWGRRETSTRADEFSPCILVLIIHCSGYRPKMFIHLRDYRDYRFGKNFTIYFYNWTLNSRVGIRVPCTTSTSVIVSSQDAYYDCLLRVLSWE